MYSPAGKCWEFPFRAYVLDRTTLEQNMAREAKALGAEFRLGCAVEAFTSNGKLRVGPSFLESIETSVLVAADGFPSRAVSSGGLADARYDLPENVAVNYQYVMDNLNVESKVTEMYMGSAIAPGGYAWIIPKSNSTANVGVGVRTTFTRSGRGRDYLDHFVREYSLTRTKLALGKVQSMIADVLPVDGVASRTQSDRVVVAGDSAGMVMPTNGGGIPTAMISGRIAGEAAALHVLRGEPLSSYETRWMNAIGHELHASTRMRRFADIFMRHDTLFDLTMRVLRAGGIKKVVTCKIPTGLDTLMRLCGY